MSISIYRLGEQIKKFRELRNYTQEHLAERLEMSAQGYGKIERNEVEVTLHKLQRIADILGTTIQDILGFEDRFVFNNQECNNFGVVNAAHFQEFQKLYEARIADMQKEIERLHQLLAKALDK